MSSSPSNSDVQLSHHQRFCGIYRPVASPLVHPTAIIPPQKPWLWGSLPIKSLKYRRFYPDASGRRFKNVQSFILSLGAFLVHARCLWVLCLNSMASWRKERVRFLSMSGKGQAIAGSFVWTKIPKERLSLFAIVTATNRQLEY